MATPATTNPPLRYPDAAAAFDLASLLIRLGLVVLGAIILIRVAAILIGRLERAIRERGVGDEHAREKRASTLGSILRGLSRSMVFLVAVLMAVHELGLDITPAVAAAGGFAVAAGLGAQSLVRDWIGGFFIIHDNQYVVGDVVRVVGVTGTVEALTVRHTEVRDGDGALHFVSNGEIKQVANLTKSWSAPVVRVPVSLLEDPARAAQVLESFLRGLEEDPEIAELLEEPPKLLGVDDVSAGQFTMLLQARTIPENRHAVARALRMGAIRSLQKAGLALHAPSVGDGPSAAPAAGGSGGVPSAANAGSQGEPA
jgi:small conductance mechanosensitive channel